MINNVSDLQFFKLFLERIKSRLEANGSKIENEEKNVITIKAKSYIYAGGIEFIFNKDGDFVEMFEV